ncbi:ferredoxin--NADP reductase [Aequorivita echinoideorum]|uniref:Ferredoxin--NADP reductase n=1 Tax=Aequorivita echinoideorum TaxID=1549647 RepID=A0ABS5S5R5_9FLAO|nr:ferredoxin--NADP reductase [Aequorivita echinoideorum]MBT0607180.1 ferredoxin--NADP reductase [Aequorivita echinoideorum]
MSEFHTLTVSEVKKETPNSVSISFTVPPGLADKFKFKAGQYVTIKHKHLGEELRRAYSICSSPKSGILKIGVKKVANGAFSIFANTQLKAGDLLEVMPPTGKFILEENLKNYVAFAAGSGITPVISLIKSTLEERPEANFLLVYGNQNVDETMFYNEILELQKKYIGRFHVEFVFSRKEEENARFGRIDRSIVNLFLKNKYAETNFESFYLCGPEEMIDEVSATLKHNGINEKQIHHELFSTAEKGLLVESHDGNTNITITLDDEEEIFVMPQTKSILEAALDQGLDPPYSCQGGICSTCIARIKEGKAEMRKNQILTDSEIAEGLILTCQAHPTTPTILVDYDDV